MAKRLDEISFDEMQEIADSGAKVLHDRCIQMGKKFNCDIMAKSTFSEEGGTKICQKIETSEVKSIVKNENLIVIEMQSEEFYSIYQNLLQNNILVEAFEKEGNHLRFRIRKSEQNKVIELLDSQYPTCQVKKSEQMKLSIIGYGIIQDNQVLQQIIEILKKYQIEIMDMNLTQTKIEILVKEIENSIVSEIHQKLIK